MSGLPNKKKARAIAYRAIAAGTLGRQPCEECGSEPAEMHHADYSKPLDVTFLCKPHHEALHARLDAEGQGPAGAITGKRSFGACYCSLEDAQLIERAATADHRSVSNFITYAAVEKARSILEPGSHGPDPGDPSAGGTA